MKQDPNQMSTNRHFNRERVSGWSKEADIRIKNRKWLRYSSQVARRMLAAIDETPEMNQKKLAELIGVTPQQISKIAKGKENLTLETIAKLSTALGTELINFPEYRYNVLPKSRYYIPGRPDVISRTIGDKGCPVLYVNFTQALFLQESYGN